MGCRVGLDPGNRLDAAFRDCPAPDEPLRVRCKLPVKRVVDPCAELEPVVAGMEKTDIVGDRGKGGNDGAMCGEEFEGGTSPEGMVGRSDEW